MHHQVQYMEIINQKNLKENDNTIKPISLYGATKLSNEIIAYTYAKLFKLNSVGLRFFTVYGPWGKTRHVFKSVC